MIRAEKKKKPNIIYILADDLGYGDLSCYGQKKFNTPHIDSLADEGMKFTDHYAGSTVCAPSRCSLMTGRHTGHAYIRGNKEIYPVGQHPLPANTITIPGILQKAGYKTGGFGKWGLGYPGSEGDPLNQGFDTFYGYNCQRNAHSFYPFWLYHDKEKIELDGKTYSHDLIMDKALEFIKENKENPFFCYMPLTIPHAAMEVPEEYSKPFRKPFAAFNGVKGVYGRAKVDNPVAGFAGMMKKLDESVGKVMSLLKELNIDQETIVMFTSDNGPHREGGHRPDFFNSNGPLKGIKRDLYEGGIRVPFLVRWPGTIIDGKVTDHASAFWDVLPTVCDLSRMKAPEKTDGISFLPTLLRKKQKKHDYLYWEFHGKRALRMDQWKMLKSKNRFELYDLSIDPGEERNIGEQNFKVFMKMKKIMKKAHEDSEIFPNSGKPW
jgi:arylsulfatase A-like enzyme